MICGKSGCGKTSLLAQLIPGISQNIKFICIASMVYHNPFHLAIQDWCSGRKKTCVINDNPERIRAFVDGLHRYNMLIPGKKEMLMIFDDFSIHNRSGSEPENLVVEAFTRWRNLGVNIIIICQDASMVATSCRNCTNMRILFSSASKTALHTFMKDIVDRVPDPLVLQDLVRYIISVPYTYILVRENPLDVSVGKGTDIKKVMTEKSVIVPTYQELMHQMGASNPSQLKTLGASMQLRMGNTAHQNKDRLDSEKDNSDDDSTDSDFTSD